ncbi:HAD family hydrolase [Culturomica sp.]|uniref:HAD family hydrolase n=1 Tax=Culturomica sp. TaxID=1926652 RepID=UPI000E7EDA53|nr:HAD family hydrolase [Culturomica sp.]HBO27603.1 HAD family hydrolase [Culturomica sp.]
MKQYKNIVWDWNGTLLDDKNTGVNTLNRMLEKRKLKTLSLENYRDVFGFPVEDFYRRVGFDLQKETLHDISVDFVDTYDIFAEGIGLNPGVRETLDALQKAGIRQYILSALREDLLSQMVKDFNIGPYFFQVCGSDNIYAAGKIERGKRMVEKYGICPEETLMIGDTTHDAEVAEALGFGKLLYTGGHNSEWRLLEKGDVIQGMECIPDLLLN